MSFLWSSLIKGSNRVDKLPVDLSIRLDKLLDFVVNGELGGCYPWVGVRIRSEVKRNLEL